MSIFTNPHPRKKRRSPEAMARERAKAVVKIEAKRQDALATRMARRLHHEYFHPIAALAQKMGITEDELAQRFARLRAREKLVDDCEMHREELERAYPGGIPKWPTLQAIGAVMADDHSDRAENRGFKTMDANNDNPTVRDGILFMIGVASAALVLTLAPAAEAWKGPLSAVWSDRYYGADATRNKAVAPPNLRAWTRTATRMRSARSKGGVLKSTARYKPAKRAFEVSTRRFVI
jgi:hypothetical protein